MSSVENLQGYCDASGFDTWSFDNTIKALTPEQQEAILNRARRYIEIYGPFDSSKGTETVYTGVTRFQATMCELIYTVAELLYYYGLSVKTVVGNVKSERIGSYSYTTNQGTTTGQHPARQILENNEHIMAYITYLKDNESVPMGYGTVVFPESTQLDAFGQRPFFDSFDNRLEQAMNAGLIRNRNDYIQRVYGAR